MSFIVQCPHVNCRKCRLSEEAQRGAEVACLSCKKAVAADFCGSAQRPKMPALPTTAPGAPPVAERQRIVNCPQCNTLQRTRPNRAERGITCRRCNNVFTP